jgi:hypothetical protein
MKESQLLGTLLPAHPDYAPIIEALRDKYKLPEINPDDEPIKEIYLGDKIIPLDELRMEIENSVRENLYFLPPDTAKLYKSAKLLATPNLITDLDQYPANIRTIFESFVNLARNLAEPIAKVIDVSIEFVTNAIILYLLTGETEEVPNDWISKVASSTISDEPVIFVMAGQLADPEVIIQQFREEYNRIFGTYHPKITKIHTSAAYYLRLQKQKKPWNYIVEEYIRLNNFSMPRDRTSKKYIDTWRKYSEQLKKRIQRTQTVFDILGRDKKP